MSKKSKEENKEKESKNIKEKIKEFYKTQYKKLLILPFLLLFISLILIGIQYATTGDFFDKGISLKGGISITISTEKKINQDLLKQGLLNEFPENEVNIRTLSSSGTQTGIIVESDITNKDKINLFIEYLENELEIQQNKFTIEEVGSQLGKSFFKETSLALLIAFILMSVVVFAFFRNPVISGAVILSAFSDIVVTIAILNIIGFKVGTAGIAALLMLISYSVDTDVLLSTRVTRRKRGSVFDAVLSSMRTGMTMTLTTLFVVSAALIFSTSLVLKEIMFIVLIGLLVDIINTWAQNAGLIRIYYQRKKNES